MKYQVGDLFVASSPSFHYHLGYIASNKYDSCELYDILWFPSDPNCKTLTDKQITEKQLDRLLGDIYIHYPVKYETTNW